MGQARQRGTFTQRKEQAWTRSTEQDTLLEKMHDNMNELARIEAEVEAMAMSNGQQFVDAYWKHSGINRRILRSSSFIDPAVVTAFK